MTRKIPKPRTSKKSPQTEKAEAKRPVGRPSAYNSALASEICTLIAEGLSLRAICKRDGMPSRSAVFAWLIKHEDFVGQYALARELQADWLFDEILEIADDAMNDFVTHQTAEGVTVNRVDHEHIQRARLRVDTRKWMAGKLAPKKYGDQITQRMVGADGGPVATVTYAVSDQPLTEDEWVAKHVTAH
jgi:hypothetical protein